QVGRQRLAQAKWRYGDSGIGAKRAREVGPIRFVATELSGRRVNGAAHLGTAAQNGDDLILQCDRAFVGELRRLERCVDQRRRISRDGSAPWIEACRPNASIRECSLWVVAGRAAPRARPRQRWIEEQAPAK